jgi:hypothetical protein
VIRVCRNQKNVTERPEKIKKVNDVTYLVVSSTIDYSSDLICYELERRRKSYLRINRDHFAEYKILYSLEADCLNIKMDAPMSQGYGVCSSAFKCLSAMLDGQCGILNLYQTLQPNPHVWP